MGARILECTEAQYHADELSPVPTLSRSVAIELYRTRSPAHARAMHPRLGGKSRKPTEEMQDGTVLHALILGQPDPREILDVDDYRTNAAKAMRDAAIAAGKIPVKAKNSTWHTHIAKSFAADLLSRGIGFRHGEVDCEVAIEFDDEGVLCRTRLDAVRVADGLVYVDDLKFVEDASESAVVRSCLSHGYDIQAHVAVQVIEMIKPEYAGRVRFRLIACEKPTGHVSVHHMGATMRELGRRRWEWARDKWRECMEAKRWPGYPSTDLEAPQYALMEAGVEL